jgi:carbonic anhydrase/acetyltransferase-like protein (isoleucine patch superfamily)/RimJ/RimL family protein N-acetyltransferase
MRHRDLSPSVHPTAYVAPSAVLVGDVRVGPGARILHGAVLTAEDGLVTVGEDTVVMEHALVRGRERHPAEVGSAVMIGPNAHVNGSSIADEVFVATGASLFPGSRIGAGAEIRINAVVQVNTVLPAGAVVPIGWIAVGDPAAILSPERHDEIWAVQRELDFGGTVYGVGPDVSMRELMRRQSTYYGEHRHDVDLTEEVREKRPVRELSDPEMTRSMTAPDPGAVVLSDGVVTLRCLTRDDVAAHVAGEDEDQVRWLNEGHRSEPSRVETWIAQNQHEWRTGGPRRHLGIRDAETDALVGNVEAHLAMPGLEPGEVNVSYAVFPAWRGRGVAARAVRLLCDWVETLPDARTAVIRVDAENPHSHGVAVAAGFARAAPMTPPADALVRYEKPLSGAHRASIGS